MRLYRVSSMENKSVGPKKNEPPDAEKLKVFLSYSRQDIIFVDRLRTALKRQGINVLLDREDIEKGEEWWGRIQQLIMDADTTLFILSPNSVISDICQKEVNYAEKLNKRILPIVANNIDNHDIPAALTRLNYIFFTENTTAGASGDFDEAVIELVRTLEMDIGWIREHTRIGGLAQRWEEHGQPSDMMLRGAEISSAETWLTTHPKNAPNPTDSQVAYITESRRSATQRLRRTIFISVTITLIAIGLAIFANWQRNVAVRQTKIATARRLATESNAVLGTYPQRAILLAAEAVKASDEKVRTAEQALRNSLLQPSGFGLNGHKGPVLDVAISANSRKLVTASEDGTARLWDLTADDPSQTAVELRGHKGLVTLAAISTDNRYLVTASSDKAARLWDLTADDPSQTAVELRGHKNPVTVAAISADSRYLVTASNDDLGTASRWDFIINNPSRAAVVLRDHKGPVAVISADSRYLVTASIDKKALLWDLTADDPSQTAVELRVHDDPVNPVISSANSRKLVTAREDGIIRLWDLTADDPSQTAVELRGHKGLVTVAAISADSRYLVTASEDGIIRLWDLTADDPSHTAVVLKGHTRKVVAAAISSDSRKLVTASNDNTARLWDLTADDPSQTAVELRGYKGSVT